MTQILLKLSPYQLPDSNILDLFFTTNPTLVQRVSILLGISDHDIVQIQVNTTVYIPIQEGKLGWDEAGTRSLTMRTCLKVENTPHKAAGSDQIKPIILKNLSTPLSPILKHLFQKSLDSYHQSGRMLMWPPSLFLALLIFLQLEAHMSRSPTRVWHYWKIDKMVEPQV